MHRPIERMASLQWQGTHMLEADKKFLERELSRSILQIQWKELEYLHTNFRNLATSSAVLYVPMPFGPQ